MEKLQQEKAVLEKHKGWLEKELAAKAAEVLEVKKLQSSSAANLQAQLEDAKAQIGTLDGQLMTALANACDELRAERSRASELTLELEHARRLLEQVGQGLPCFMY